MAKKPNELHRLTALEPAPGEQFAYALKLIQARRNTHYVQTALDTLAAHAERLEYHDPALRALLLETYAYYDADGIKRDPSSPVRTAAISALIPVLRADDISLLERAASTYERVPPGFWEEAGKLRAAAVSAIMQLDPPLAAFHAVRLLGEDASTLSGMMSGEPCLTAVRVLAGQGLVVPIYAYLMQAREGVAEAIAESLRCLVSIPVSLLPAVIEKYREATSDIVVGGVIDLLLSRTDYHTGFIAEFLTTTQNMAVYRYLLTAIIASRREDYLCDLLGVAQGEKHPRKVSALTEALALVKGKPEVDTELARLKSAHK